MSLPRAHFPGLVKFAHFCRMAEAQENLEPMQPVSTLAETGQPQFELDFYRLQFRDPRAERMYQRDAHAESIDFIRTYFVAGTLLYLLFGALDRLLGGPAQFFLLAIRIGFVAPSLLGIYALSFHREFQRRMQLWLAMAMLVSGMGIIAMTAIMGPPFNSLYYAGLIVVASYCSSFIRLKFRYSAVISVWLFVCYQLIGLWINPIPLPIFISNDFFLGMAIIIGLFAAYIQEMYMRRAYLAQKIVEEKNFLVSEALAEAMRANKSKGEFLATMSHELRTPLNAIIGFSDIIRRELFGSIRNEKYTEYARDIHDSGAHLLAIINDILDLAKAESGKLELTEREFDLAETMRACIRMCQMRADESGVRLDVAGVQREIRIIADERLVLQIFCKSDHQCDKIYPGGWRHSRSGLGPFTKGITVRISDTGIGIAPENMDRVLRPFEQVEATYSRRHGGLGLGLPYAKRLTELHGGSLEIESHVGQGTCVTVRIPAWRLTRALDELESA